MCFKTPRGSRTLVRKARRNDCCMPALAFLAAFCFFCVPILAGWGNFTGDEEGLWDQDGCSVVVGKIRNMHNGSAKGPAFYTATLQPEALLCGCLDPSLHPSLPVAFMAQALNTSIDQVPADGSTVLAVVSMRDGRVGIVSDSCRFMPGDSSLVSVTGLDDPKVAETLKRLQAARKAGDAKRAAATQSSAPATAPD